MSIRTIAPQQLATSLAEGCRVDLIDVRTPLEFRELHAVRARNVPLDLLDPASVLQCRVGAPEDPIYLICRTGIRGREACEKFLRAGFPQVVNVHGGTLAWERAGLPVHRGKKTISVQRQVQITAGSLILLGTVLGWLLHPAFAGLAAAVGAGLVWTGITDSCMMGLLLARLPWNRVPPGAGRCAACENQAGAPAEAA